MSAMGHSATLVRRLDGLETACEDYGQAVIYNGTVAERQDVFELDGHHLIEHGKTSFANPAVTIARSTQRTFAGISPTDVPGFIVAQILGALAAAGLCHWLLAESRGQ